ncbi:cell division cycle-associated 7-like protein isoform X1 [Chiloscyllium plagiosum]|uniref:cell division cycle-associated 7-like protein isoform X1 n=2 Tax=Chiloscyllium plagiosum TaxID=36176 RepID=UPI001CB83622|nr:cell division cycle-associated 7-like protein isoform X1 [Chiloscyllium plagiosum]
MVMSKLITDIFNTQSDDEEFLGFPEEDFRNRDDHLNYTPKLIADIFDAPSDDEFLGFQDFECNTRHDHADDSPNQHINSFQSKFITEELIEIFTVDSWSTDYVFEGFPEHIHESDDKEDLRSESLEMEDEDEGFTEYDDDESSIESEMEAMPKKGHFGLRVAFKFPTRRPVKRKQRDIQESEESESDDDSAPGKKNSNVLLKRAMNIKENKEMLAKLMAELKTMPGLFPVKVCTSSSPKQKRTPKRTFSEGKVERRVNPSRSARPPEGFSVEKFAISPTKLMSQVKKFHLRTDLTNRFVEDGSLTKRRRRSSKGTPRPVDDITEEDLENVAITVKDKIYDRCLGSTCHQCRQKTIDTKTVCRNQDCYGVRGQFCGPCLRNRYGENVRSALLNPDWVCPPCRGTCNCSFCRRRDGRCATGILVHLAKFYGYDNVQAYLESLQKQLTED